MSKVCEKHQKEPAFIYGQCIGCELEMMRSDEEKLKLKLAWWEDLSNLINDPSVTVSSVITDGRRRITISGNESVLEKLHQAIREA